MKYPKTISVAPMLDCTDRHFRFLVRLLSRSTWVYTEMMTTKEVLQSRKGNLAYNFLEYPVALQLGGSDPWLLAKCAQIAAHAGYNEVNLNVGCPSERIQSGKMGACLMLEPEQVAVCVYEMSASLNIPVTVKCRLGVDSYDSYEHLTGFIEQVSAAGCNKFIIHARKAWLKGLSPKQNRDIPPLNYEMVFQLKLDFPQLEIILNGGINSLDQAEQYLPRVDGVMIGRAAYNNPYMLADVDQRFFGLKERVSESEVVERYIEYLEKEMAKGVRLHSMTRHLLGLFYNKPRAKYWRKHLNCNSNRLEASSNIIKEALAIVIAG